MRWTRTRDASGRREGDIGVNGSIDVVTIQLGDERMAFPTGILREILGPVPVTRVPMADSFAAGLINVRGTVVPLADLHVAFGLGSDGPTTDTRLLVLEVPYGDETVVVAITADKVHDVTQIDTAAFDEVPSVGTRWPPEFVRGVGRQGDSFLILPDMQRIFRSLCADGAEPRKDQVS